jgi:hypothetical protein
MRSQGPGSTPRFLQAYVRLQESLENWSKSTLRTRTQKLLDDGL